MKKENQEEKAIRFIEKKERKKCEDYHKLKNLGWDIKIGDRYIEVKARKGEKPSSLEYTKSTYNFAKNNKNFWLYYVCNILKKPKIVKYSGKTVISKSKPKIYYRFNPNKKSQP